MNKYVLAFRGAATRTPPSDFESQWASWFARLGDTVIDPGNRVLSTRTLTGDGAIEPVDGLTGYVVISAADADEAARHAAGCPGLAYGIAVEIAAVLPPVN